MPAVSRSHSVVGEEHYVNANVNDVSVNVNNVNNDVDLESITSRYFANARMYDEQLNLKQFNRESDANTYVGDWEVQPCVSRKNYRNWLYEMRSKPGMQNFRRDLTPEYEPEILGGPVVVIEVKHKTNPDDGKIIIERTSYLRGRGGRRLDHAQSTERGVKIDDPDYKPRMVTAKLGAYIRRMREGANLTQKELAEKIDAPTDILRNMELGGVVTYNPEDPILKRMAKFFDVPSIRYQE
jgi:DNA-binding XRE family transcriptional regulator